MFLHLAVIFLVGGVLSENVSFHNCIDESICKVDQVRVIPCKEATTSKPCRLKRGTNATIEFDYIPYFPATNLIGQAYSVSLIDLPLLGMERDACKFTTCPIEVNQKRTYSNTLFLSPIFPLMEYTVKWRIWDYNHDVNGCCVTFRIKLYR